MNHIIKFPLTLQLIEYILSGFMSLEDESVQVPGNAGLKDQVMVLKWIQKNIGRFRGDKRNVTLFGQSSGAACVHLHMLSPMSRGETR